MLLHDIGNSPDSTFKRINHHLETNYGFKISEDVSDKDLVAIMEQLEEEITDLKVKGDDAKGSSEISKRLLVLEGLKNLREYALIQLGAPDRSHHEDKVVGMLIDFVVEDFCRGGDFEESMKDAMKQYRSSKYRFPDDIIEQKVRHGAAARARAEVPDTPTSEIPVVEDHYGAVGKRSSAFGGYNAAPPDTPAAKRVLTAFNNSAFKLKDEDDEEDNEQVPMIRDKHGRMVPDPFAAQAAQRRKGMAMKEDNELDEVVKTGYHDPKTQQASRPTSPEGRSALAKEVGANRSKMRSALPANNANRRGHPSGGTNFGIDSKFGGRDPNKPFVTSSNTPEGKTMKEHANLVKNLRRLLETEVSQAEVMMAAKGFAQELQEMVEKIGRLQNEDLPPVTDQMRETYGMDSASAFQTQIYGALQSVMDSLYTAKQQVDDAVGNMAETGQVSAQTDMDKDIGMDDGMDAGPDDGMDAGPDDLDNIGNELDMAPEDEFGGEEALGREKKMESALQKKVMEMKKLVEKAKKLKEARI